jgi:hypothetical protein
MVMVFKKFHLPSHVRLLATFDSPVLLGLGIKLGDFFDKASSSVIDVKFHVKSGAKIGSVIIVGFAYWTDDEKGGAGD